MSSDEKHLWLLLLGVICELTGFALLIWFAWKLALAWLFIYVGYNLARTATKKLYGYFDWGSKCE